MCSALSTQSPNFGGKGHLKELRYGSMQTDRENLTTAYDELTGFTNSVVYRVGVSSGIEADLLDLRERLRDRINVWRTKRPIQ